MDITKIFTNLEPQKQLLQEKNCDLMSHARITQIYVNKRMQQKHPYNNYVQEEHDFLIITREQCPWEAVYLQIIIMESRNAKRQLVILPSKT